MITAIIISIIFFVIGLLAMIGAILLDWKDGILEAGITTTVISTIVMASLAVCCHGIKQNSPKEYPASDYTFKIKVVEFKEQRDTILVVIPKEK